MDLFSPNIRPTWDASFLSGTSSRMVLVVMLVLLAVPALADDADSTSREAVYRELQQAFNSPNPFNPHTTINYSLLKDAQVQVEIYDLRGRLVVTLLDEFQTEGDHFAIWKTETSPSGTYFYRLAVDDIQVFGKMSLVK
jgi:hypothetical protein